MKNFRFSTFAGVSLGALAMAFYGVGTASAHGSSGGGSSGGSSGGGLFSHKSKSHGSSGGSSGGGLFSHKSRSHGSSGGSSGGGLFSHKSRSHGSSGGSSGGGFVSHGSSGGSSGGGFVSHGSSGGSSGGGFVTYGSTGGSYGGAPVMVSPQAAPQAAPQAVPQGAPQTSTTTGVGHITLNVPQDAKVYLQDQLMPISGAERRFVTPELPLGDQRVYTVKVEVVRDGQTIVKTAQAPIAAGQDVRVSVTFDKQNPKELVASIAQVASL